MATHTLETQEAWDALAAAGGARPSGVITVARSIDITGVHAEELAFAIERGARLTALSGCANWYTIKSGALALVWDGTCNAVLQVDESCGERVAVTLVGFPSDIEPYVAAGGAASVRFERLDRCDSAQASDGPAHYTWVGSALARDGAPARSADLQSWDILDALFPDSPCLWNVGKYLIRFGRKGDPSRRIVDLRKARAYLDRAIAREEAHGEK